MRIEKKTFRIIAKIIKTSLLINKIQKVLNKNKVLDK